MKRILLLLFLAGVAANAQEIKWLTLDEAFALQKTDPKPIFMDVYTDWCGPCKELDKKTFHDKSFMAYINTNYYAVKFNAEGNSEVIFQGRKYINSGFVEERKGKNTMHDFIQYLDLPGYPTMVTFDRHGKISGRVVGYFKAEELMEELKKINK
ncbi:thioredoxin family protein [Flavobacterium sp. 3HN19-14]|uniref:thioredoxin family protein n=1 Tax=Flavobacterium sp. 3HN19-14 TaxID=3448133 RepID=UPI003EDFDD36